MFLIKEFAEWGQIVHDTGKAELRAELTNKSRMSGHVFIVSALMEQPISGPAVHTGLPTSQGPVFILFHKSPTTFPSQLTFLSE
jgi:uncharacterized membrane protein